MNDSPHAPERIAIIGMSGRFPGAADPDGFWQNLIDGRDCITRFPARSGPDGARHVGARGILDSPDLFDAEFFGIYPKEAELMDPQHRVFLECAWEALEDAGCDPARFPGMIGVYAGLSLNSYLLYNLRSGSRLAENYQVGEYQTMLGNDKDFLPVRVSYKLNLRGPSMTIQSACSTSLVAICQAATALLAYQCDLALAGGVSISFPQQRDYLYQEDGMVSPDGTCRAFDAAAAGTVFGHGCGVILLKRLSEAIADRDPILAVIDGWAVNNDGSEKIGFAAPGVESQAEVIRMAHAAAGVDAAEISYVEAHGTGTPLGDPIEVAALTQAFRDAGVGGNGTCTLGTAKTHIGHLDCAAGVTGVIKVIQQLRHGRIPALLHYQKPNPRIDFAGSPFAPAAAPRDWLPGTQKRIAGVSAFGVGGTNAHVVLEEPPAPAPTPPAKPRQILALSARTATAAAAMAGRLADFLEKETPDLADVAHTLATGRRVFRHRIAIAAGDVAEAAGKLRAAVATAAPETPPRIAFLFPGQGSQYAGMGRALHQEEPVFRDAIDECARLLQPLLRRDIRTLLFPAPEETAAAEREIQQTWLTQPCVFSIEYALSKLWISRGVTPSLLIGHSIGEYVAAVLAGTFKLGQALELLAARARLMQQQPEGAMLAVRAAADELELPAGLDLAAINGPDQCTVAGPREAIAAWQAQLESRQTACRLLETSHAFHSRMMDPVVEPLTAEAAMIPARPPTVPWVSTRTGAIMDAAAVADPAYWARQVRQPVDFPAAIRTAAPDESWILLEVGPGRALSGFARRLAPAATVIATLAGPADDLAAQADAAARLWQAGADLDLAAVHGPGERNRLRLPTYPFERKSHWIDRSNQQPEISAPAPTPPTPAPVIAARRTSDVSGQLRAMVLELSGISVADDMATFTELGFDSLFLTQASQAIQSRFGVKITFREMLGDLSSIAALAARLEREVPATEPAAAPPAVHAGDSLEQLMANNIQLMQAMLSGTATPAGAVVRWPAGHERKNLTSTRFGPYKPIEKGERGGLTECQQRALDGLIARYESKTPGSKKHAAEHRPHYADPRAVAGFKARWKEMVYPIVAERSKGAKLWDIDGNEYIDITMGFGTYLFGHSPDWLTEAISTQLQKGIEIGPQSPIAGKLARAICGLTGMDRVTFCNTGSEAVMAAMRLARTVTGRDRIAYFTGDYHGMFEEVLVRGAWVDGVYKPQPIAPGIPQSLVANMLVLDYADPAALEILRRHAHELAAVMVEPVQSRAPGLQPREFLHELRAITREAGSALIFDEVVTGFRCAPGGAQEYFGVRADLATYGKVIGGGMPIGVLAGRREYMDALDGGAWNYGDDSFPEVGVTFFAGTFVRHPLALAAAWRVVQHLMEEGPRLQIEMTERVARLCRTLNEHFTASGVPIRLPHFSAHAVIEHAAELEHASLLWYHLREKGIHAWEGRPLYFTTAHGDEDLDRVVRAFVEAVSEMQAAGFLPPPAEGAPAAPQGFPRHDSAPTTEAQREILHAVMMGDEANCSFNESNIIHLSGPLDVTSLRRALADLVARHPALRSTFSEDGRQQHFHPSAAAVEMLEHDFSSAAAQSPAALLPLSLVREAETSTPFDLAHGPLLRLQLVRLGGDSHQLLFTAHHVICDGWSFGMLMAELSHCYNSRKAGRLPALPPATSFAEYARWEMERAASGAHRAAEDYWIAKFAKEAPVLQLPTDRPRPAMKTYAGAMESLDVDPALHQRLKKASPVLGGTLFATLLAAFATLLHRLTGQEDIVIGVPAAGQTRVGRDELIGHCLNFLPLRLAPAAAREFGAFAAEVKESVLEAYDHQDHTFGSLLRKIKVERDPSRVPLVSVIFNIDKAGLDRIRFDGLEHHVETNPKQFVNFDLFFNLVQSDERLTVECEYNTDLHDAATIRSWLARYQNLLESLVESAGRETLGAPDALSAADRQLLDRWNDTGAALPFAPSIQSFFEQQADRQPQAPALRAGGRTFTYQELDRHANSLAAELREMGVGRETLVGVCVERRAELIVALLAVLKSGGAYVPIDPLYPAERISYILRDAEAPVLLTQESLLAKLPAVAGERRLVVDGVLERAAGRLPAVSQPADLAYVIYTSGSTGKPKGVAIEHRNAIALVGWALGVYPPEELAGVLFSTSICFDLSIFEIFVTLAGGGTIILAENALDLRDHPHAAEITLINTVPSAIAELVDARLIPAGVRTINLAGEALPQALVERLCEAAPGVKVYDLYGPSEDTTYSTFARREPGGRATIGRPISNTRAYIVGEDGRLVAPGTAGELLLGGAGLARGYLNRPELTAEKFIPNTLDARGGRLYRTGDRARYFEDGEIQFLGRLDQQVKLRGHRIELGEIESLLESHPAVEQAIAAVCDGRLVAYIRGGAADGTAIWKDQWDMLYQSAIRESGSARLDRLDSVIAGWAGVENLDTQVGEWIDTTVERVRKYGGRRIYEIGCGTGQLLSRLAPDAECYWASDISQVAIDSLERQTQPPQVRLRRRAADDFSEIPAGFFDCVVINSVAQYFPDADYLLRVLEGAVKLLQPGGRIYLGDMQSRALLATHHAMALREHLPPGTTVAALREKIAQRVARETELSADPAWFELVAPAIPGIGAVEILLRRGRVVNETTCYHYDVVFHTSSPAPMLAVPPAVPWNNLNLEQLEAMLVESRAPVRLAGIPDARLAAPLAFRAALACAAAEAAPPPVPGAPPYAVSAEQLHALAEQCGFRAHVRWVGDGTAGLLDALFVPAGAAGIPLWPKPAPGKPAEFINVPHARADSPADSLKAWVAAKLPAYMVPASFVMLDAFPLTPNGKVDRKALPAPAAERKSAPAMGPRNETEAKLMEIWKQVLECDEIGITDDIFALGGDSILIFQISTRANRAGIPLAPAQVFRLRTIAAIAAEAVLPTAPASSATTIQRVNRDAYRRKL